MRRTEERYVIVLGHAAWSTEMSAARAHQLGTGPAEDDGMALDNLLAMARAVERNWCAAWATLGDVREEPRTIVDDTRTFLRVHTPNMPESLLNIVLRFQSSDPVTR